MNKSSSRYHKINIYSLFMITSAFIVSVRNLPMIAETGSYMVFFILFSIFSFLIPAALISAELATGWPQKGGVYVWVREAFGERWGFLAIWLQWIQSVIWYPAVLSFVGATMAFIINPNLAENKFYLILLILVIFWGITFINFHGMKISSRISTIGLLIGVILPVSLIIFFGVFYLYKGDPIQIDLSLNLKNFIPDTFNINKIVLFSGFIYAVLGIENSAVHAEEVNNPKRNYPLAIFFAALLLIIVNILGALSIAIVIPQKEISLVSGVMDALNSFFIKFNLSFAIPIMALFIVVGAIGQVSTVVVGPVKGILSAAKNGNLPRFFQYVNNKGMPTHLLVFQGFIVSILSLVFLFMPTISSSYWILLDLLGLVYLSMYILMFLSAIRLRYTKPYIHRAYRIPAGNIGMWITGSIGLLSSLFTITIGFFPPTEFPVGNIIYYDSFLFIGLIVMLIIPLIIYQLRRSSLI